MIKKYRYTGRHREETVARRIRPWQRVTALIAATLVAVLGVQTAASAVVVHVKWGDTFSGLVRTYCGTSDWQSVAFPNRDKNLIYAGETIDIECAAGVKDVVKAQTAEPAAAPVTSNSGWFNPLPGHQPHCNYWQWRGSYNHKGEDIPASHGMPILAAHSGTVWTGWDNGAGNYTVITHPDGVATVYMHQSSFAVRTGWVDGGDVIGYVGSTGDSSGPHLHFEVHPWGAWNGTVNPSSFLAERGVSLGC